MPTDGVLRRREEILQSIQDSKEGLTLNELADIHGAAYHTCRNYVQDLIRARKVDIGPKIRNKSTVYVAMDISTSPKWMEKTVWEWVLNQQSKLEGDAVHASGGAWRGWVLRVSQLYMHAFSQISGETITTKQLLDVKKALQLNRAALVELIEAHDVLLDNPNLWDPTSFAKLLLQDPKNPLDHNSIPTVFQAIQYRVLQLKAKF